MSFTFAKKIIVKSLIEVFALVRSKEISSFVSIILSPKTVRKVDNPILSFVHLLSLHYTASIPVIQQFIPLFPIRFPNWHQIGTQITQTGTVLRFTGKNAHAIMVMLKIVSAPYPFHFSGICTRRCHFFAVHTPCAF